MFYLLNRNLKSNRYRNNTDNTLCYLLKIHFLKCSHLYIILCDTFQYYASHIKFLEIKKLHYNNLLGYATNCKNVCKVKSFRQLQNNKFFFIIIQLKTLLSCNIFAQFCSKLHNFYIPEFNKFSYNILIRETASRSVTYTRIKLYVQYSPQFLYKAINVSVIGVFIFCNRISRLIIDS